MKDTARHTKDLMPSEHMKKWIDQEMARPDFDRGIVTLLRTALHHIKVNAALLEALEDVAKSAYVDGDYVSISKDAARKARAAIELAKKVE